MTAIQDYGFLRWEPRAAVVQTTISVILSRKNAY
jgi:hypothetical protein